MKRICLLLTLVFVAATLAAQEPPEEKTEFDMSLYPGDAIYPDVPVVIIETGNLNLMRSFYPLYYDNEQQISRDIRYVNRNDSALVAEWDSLSYLILTTMTSLSGIKWVEDEFKLNLFKYLPVNTIYNPAAMPLEGIKTSKYIEVAPDGLQRLLNIMVIMAGRNIEQIESPQSIHHYLAVFPLVQQSAYRFDVLALTLAISTAEHFMEPDSIDAVTSSASWKRHYPGWIVYKDYFRENWKLTAETPLVTYLANEPYNSPLVDLTRPPRITKPAQTQAAQNEPKKLGAGGGIFGFSVAKTPLGLLEIVDIDSTGLAYMSGLQVGDQIKRVNGEVVRTARDLMGKIIDNIDSEGIYMTIIRDDGEIGILLMGPSDFEFEVD